MPPTLELRINGQLRSVAAEPDRPLLGVLRDELGLTGSKYGCGEGQCGACSVIIDGMAARSCVVRLRAVADREITTIEGLEGDDGTLHPVQQAFLDCDALQCGYCTSGMIMAATVMLQNDPNPTPETIARGLDRNLCRCGTYPQILAAVRQAADRMKGDDQ
ncbi:(2Fe-2S)-binding protein [Tautonia marina]|uniref:(2Fe-2S)-binding protein n=1 Tax=Tautonia marina TaxID=2653855 RepID=UPI0012611DC9|nr:(2Fe-2S)-binding protein [Tautonia marina]